MKFGKRAVSWLLAAATTLSLVPMPAAQAADRRDRFDVTLAETRPEGAEGEAATKTIQALVEDGEGLSIAGAYQDLTFEIERGGTVDVADFAPGVEGYEFRAAYPAEGDRETAITAINTNSGDIALVYDAAEPDLDVGKEDGDNSGDAGIPGILMDAKAVQDGIEVKTQAGVHYSVTDADGTEIDSYDAAVDGAFTFTGLEAGKEYTVTGSREGSVPATAAVAIPAKEDADSDGIQAGDAIADGATAPAMMAANGVGGGVAYYVANSSGKNGVPKGSDVAGNGAQDKPFLTITKAVQAAQENGFSNVEIKLLNGIEITKTLYFDGKTLNPGGNGLSSVTLNGQGNSITYKMTDPTGTDHGGVAVTNDIAVMFRDIELTRPIDNMYQSRLLYVRDAEAVLDNATVTNGLLAITDYHDGGSAIHVANGGVVTLQNRTAIKNCKSEGTKTSGAVFVAQGGELNITGVHISSNADCDRGEGVYVEDGGKMSMYTIGGDLNNRIEVFDEIYIETGAYCTVGASRGHSDFIKLARVFLETDETEDAAIATLAINGETIDSDINIECHDNYHYCYRLISPSVDGYAINTKLGSMDETGWEDIDGKWDIRYMDYKGVKGLYFFYFTINATFHDVDTLTGIDGEDITDTHVSYYNPEQVQNTSKEGGLLTIPEVVPIDVPETNSSLKNGGDYIIHFTTDEAGKKYRIPTPDQVVIKLDGHVLIEGKHYEYKPDYPGGEAVVRVFRETLIGAKGDLDFKISGEKYYHLELRMNGPLYTASTSITGLRMDNALSVVTTAMDDGRSIQYEITRAGAPVSGVTVGLYREGTDADEVATPLTTGADGIVKYTGLDPTWSYYFVLNYSDFYWVIERDTVNVSLSTLRGQKLTDDCDFDPNHVSVSYDVADAENWDMATSDITHTHHDTTVIYNIIRARDTIFFHSNPGESTTADTIVFHYDNKDYPQPEFQKTMQTNAETYGNLPTVTMTGYQFTGWYTEPDGGDRITNVTNYRTATSPKHLYAHWVPKKVNYSIEHWVEYIAPHNYDQYNQESGVNPGYQEGVTPTKVENGITYYLYKTVDYKDKDADSTHPDMMEKAMTSMVDPQHSWWSLDGLEITSEQECKVMAQGEMYLDRSIFSLFYTRKIYTMTYDPTEGRMTGDEKSLQVKYGSYVGAMLTAVRDGYKFGGWYYILGPQDEACITRTSWWTWLKDVTVHAKWVKSDTTYTIKLMTEDKDWIYDGEKRGLAYSTGTYRQYKTVKFDNYGQPLPAISDTELTVPFDSISQLHLDGFTYIGYNETGHKDAVGMVPDTKNFTLTPNEHGTSVIYLYLQRNDTHVTYWDDRADLSPEKHFEVDITYGDYFAPAIPPESPTKPGYDFVKWVDANGNEVNGGTQTDVYTTDCSTSIDVYPVWEARQYYLTYVPGEGTTFDTSNTGAGQTINPDVSGGYTVPYPIAYDRQIGLMPSADKAGYVFDGWMLTEGPGEGQFVTFETVANITNVIIKNDANSKEGTRPLYAQYTPYDFDLALDPNGGFLDGKPTPKHLTVVYEQAVPELPDPTREGYTFMGWLLDDGRPGETRIETGDIWRYLTANHTSVTLKASWIANRYTYKLDLNDVEKGNGSTKASFYDTTVTGAEIEFDSPYAKVLNGIVAYRNGYKFLGWSTTLDKADLLTEDTVNTLPSNSVVHAIWEPRIHYMEIYANGGDLPQRDWYSYNDYANKHYVAHAEKWGTAPLVATFNEATMTWRVPVIFDTVYGQVGELTRENYYFEGYFVNAPGWHDGDELIMHGKTIKSIDIGFTDDADETIYLDAVWTPYFDFAITQEGAAFEDGATGTKHILRTDLDALPIAVKDGYTFMGWWDDIEGDYTTLEKVKAMNEYRSFRSVFTPNVTFLGNTGKVVVDGVEHDEYTIGLYYLKKNYGKFFPARHETKTLLGWTSSDNTDLTTFENISNRSTPLTLTAQWDYIITFDVPEGGYWDADKTPGSRDYTAHQVGEWGVLPTVSLPGYKFLGWFDADNNPVTPAGLSATERSTTVYAKFGEDPVGPDDPGDFDAIFTNYTVPNYVKITIDTTETSNSVLTKGNGFVFKGPDCPLHKGKNTIHMEPTPDAIKLVEDRTLTEQVFVLALVRNGSMTELAGRLDDKGVFTVEAELQSGDEIVAAVLGDVDLNGRVNLSDATDISGHIAGVTKWARQDICDLVSDVDRSGRTNLTDATKISMCISRTLSFAYKLVPKDDGGNP